MLPINCFLLIFGFQHIDKQKTLKQIVNQILKKARKIDRVQQFFVEKKTALMSQCGLPCSATRDLVTLLHCFRIFF